MSSESNLNSKKDADDDAMDMDEEETSNSVTTGKESDNGDEGEAMKDYDEAGDEEEDEEDDFQFKWLDSGRNRNGRREYDSVFLTLHGTSFKVTKKDFILLWGLHGEEQEKEDDIMNQTIEDIWLSAGCAQVEAMWEEVDENSPDKEPKAMFRARWFFQKSDLERLFTDGDFESNISLESLKKRMLDREVVASRETGSYSMNTIGGPARVFFRAAPTEEEEEKRLAEERNKRARGEDNDKDDPPQLPKDAFTCRYAIKKLDVDGQSTKDDDSNTMVQKKSKVEVIPYEPDESSDDEGSDDDHNDEGRRKKRRRGNDDTAEEEEEESDDSSTSSDDESRLVEFVEGEGGILNQGKIRVGPQHQVPVPVFNPKTKIVSRNPTLVWSPSKTPTQAKLDDYFQEVAAILTPFAEQQMLVMGTKPLTLVPTERMEKIMEERGSTEPLTVSSVSTSTSLASPSPKNTLLRECDADALLKNLHDHNYSVEKAVAMVKMSPRDYLANWTKVERETYDDSFRRNGGSLREVAKSVASLTESKPHCLVVDYHYRFKIPDQFRRYQNKKQEQAVRMMECIEARKVSENAEVKIKNRANGNEEPVDSKHQRTGNWSDKGTADVTYAAEERRSSAKELLLDIQREMGKQIMAEVAGAIISLNQGSERESKEALLRILKNQPRLHQRLVEFLPRRFFK